MKYIFTSHTETSKAHLQVLVFALESVNVRVPGPPK